MKIKNIAIWLPVKDIKKSSSNTNPLRIGNTLNFWVENLEKEFDRLKEMWIISDEKIEEIPDFIKYLEISDIDGNKIIFVEEL